MKVLFVGEGTHDIGRPDFPAKPRLAAGVVAVLARNICPAIDAESVGVAWREIRIFNPDKKHKGWAAKVEAAILLARQYRCAGTICVADRDRDDTRLAAMDEWKQSGAKSLAAGHAVVCAVAVESIEAWTLGDQEAVAAVLGVKVDTIRKRYYKVSDVEKLHERSGKPGLRPKELLRQLAELKHREADTQLREEIAACTDVDALQKTCPKGFRPFAERLKAAFGP
jgi:hypothetical protein